MYTEIKNDQGDINSTLFIQYNGVGFNKLGHKNEPD